MGELEPWMDENFIKGVFLSAAGETVNVKVIRDKNSGYVLDHRQEIKLVRLLTTMAIVTPDTALSSLPLLRLPPRPLV